MRFDKEFQKSLQTRKDRLSKVLGMEHNIHLRWGKVTGNSEIMSLEDKIGILLSLGLFVR